MLREFKKFAMRGNVMDMAIGIILGGAFGKIVASAVADVVMPPLGMLIGGVDFKDLAVTLKDAVLGQDGKVVAAAVEVRYGAFLNTVIDFLIVAFTIFLVVKALNSLKGEAPPPAPTEKACPRCCVNIPLQAVRCPHCTSDLAAARPSGA
jgi:large conductance mechanosensitive channel